MSEGIRKIVRISPELIEGVAVTGTRYDALCTAGLPPDAKLISVEMMPSREIWIIFESLSWTPLEELELAPTFVSLFTDSLLEQASEIIGALQDQDALQWLRDYRKMQERMRML